MIYSKKLNLVNVNYCLFENKWFKKEKIIARRLGADHHEVFLRGRHHGSGGTPPQRAEEEGQEPAQPQVKILRKKLYNQIFFRFFFSDRYPGEGRGGIGT